MEYFIRAQAIISAEFPEAKFVIAGRGEDFERYRRLMLQPEKFEVHNAWITDEQRTEPFATCSMVVLPYIEASQSGVIPIAGEPRQHYYCLTQDAGVLEMLQGVLGFLSGGVAERGYGYYQCDQRYRTVHYHTSAIATALFTCHNIGLREDQVADYRMLAQRAFAYFKRQQLADGSLPHSRGDYHLLCDHRKYPRYMAMMLFHLLSASALERSN